ncbi:UNVERIFIED_CONTAM: Zeatin O-glucosyltransferase [Sesamum radiatum]|uniref:Zeatin O-glucosyltransferase n=1 Tax=Sesamum radiatum TaxID=300843 RepID=A0AAW2TK53_SESRA
MRKAELPEGFEERVKERGIVVRDWAPQLEILGHFATGGFMSHCGWNSCMESISMGVPIAAWPMHSDQPRNAVLMTEVLKIGLVVKDWARRDETVTGSTISRALERLMGSGEGEEIRQRAQELHGAVRRAWADGGITRLEMDSFVAHISR